jgi:HdeA/HdeB family/Glycine-zipper domain
MGFNRGLTLVRNRRLTLLRSFLALGAAGWICTAMPAFAGQYAQYYPPPRYGPPPGYRPPPCYAVTPGPFSGAARGAAGGALIGAISGNAGRGAGIGAAVGGMGGQFAAARHAAREPVTDGGETVPYAMPPEPEGANMKSKFVSALLLLAAAACAQQPSDSGPATTFAAVPSAPPPASPGPVPSDAQIATGKWNVERVRCSDLLGASDEDRAAAAMFYYGYLAAKAGIHVIDVSQIDDNVGKVMSECAASPTLTMPQAFRQALKRRLPAR